MQFRSTMKSLTAVLLTIGLIAARSASAQEAQDEPKPVFSLGKRPFAVLTAASVNRLKDEATFLFEAAGAPDAMEAVLTTLDENVNGLQGLNWDRPAGVMVFLNSVFPPSFEFVAFLPVSSVEEFQAMMELGPVIMRDKSGEEGHYELITPARNIQIRIHGDYALIQLPMMEPDPAFDREIPDPQGLVSALVNQFDIAISLDVESIPKGTRDLIFNVLSSTMSTQMQQRDEEPDSQYQIRRSWMQADIDAFKLMFNECKRLSFGINVDQEAAGANIDFLIDVREGTQLLEEIFAASTKPSYFTPLLSDTSPVSLSWSAVMAERDRERYDGVLEGIRNEMARAIEENGNLGPVPDKSSPLFHAVTALQDTVKEGHLDVFGQFYQDSDEKLAVVGALRVQDGEAVAAGMVDLLSRLEGHNDFGEIELAAHEHAGVSFHRILFRNPDAGANELFGSDAGVTIGCGARSIWICLGGEQSFDVLTGVMDELTAAYENPTNRQPPASMRLVLQVNQLIDLVQGAQAANKADQATKVDTGEEEEIKLSEPPRDQSERRRFGNSDRRNRMRQRREQSAALMREALAEGDDRVQIEFRPTDSGMRIRTHFALGFVRGVGRIIATRITGE